jgi:hypothetical protein
MASQQELLEFKKTQKNNGLFPEKVPLVDGYIYKNLLVIKNCPLCGYSHEHGVSSKPLVGYITIRVRHCSGNEKEFGREYVIRIAGEMNKREYDLTNKQYNELAQFNGPVIFMNSSEYFDICEKRGTWV